MSSDRDNYRKLVVRHGFCICEGEICFGPEYGSEAQCSLCVHLDPEFACPAEPDALYETITLTPMEESIRRGYVTGTLPCPHDGDNCIMANRRWYHGDCAPSATEKQAQGRLTRSQPDKIVSLPDAAQEPITLANVAGVLGKDWTGGLDSVHAVRVQRDDSPQIAVKRDAVIEVLRRAGYEGARVTEFSITPDGAAFRVEGVRLTDSADTRTDEESRVARTGACDAPGPVSRERDGSCRCLICERCGHHTGNTSQGHYWGHCHVTRKIEAFHFCCPGDCALHPKGEDSAVGEG
jgi:hypothetical protein